jgi:ribosome-binding factor A
MKNRTERAPSQRQLRVGELIRHALANIIEGGEIHQEALERTPVTVTEVRISPDLRNATAYVTPLGGGDATDVLQALNRAKPFIRRRIAGVVKLRMAPDIHFREDDSFDNADFVGGLLRQPEVARDLSRKDDDGDDEDGA